MRLELLGSRPPWRLTRRPLAVVVLVAIVFAVGRASSAEQSSHIDAIFHQEGSTTLQTPSSARPLRQWLFTNRIPHDWRLQQGASAKPHAGTTAVSTTAGPRDDELTSPELDLRSGSYVVSVRGRPITGGLSVYALDVTHQLEIANTNFWSGQRGFSDKVMTATFQLQRETKVQLSLKNWSRVPGSSRWLLRDVKLRRERAG